MFRQGTGPLQSRPSDCLLGDSHGQQRGDRAWVVGLRRREQSKGQTRSRWKAGTGCECAGIRTRGRRCSQPSWVRCSACMMAQPGAVGLQYGKYRSSCRPKVADSWRDVPAVLVIRSRLLEVVSRCYAFAGDQRPIICLVLEWLATILWGASVLGGLRDAWHLRILLFVPLRLNGEARRQRIVGESLSKGCVAHTLVSTQFVAGSSSAPSSWSGNAEELPGRIADPAAPSESVLGSGRPGAWAGRLWGPKIPALGAEHPAPASAIWEVLSTYACMETVQYGTEAL
jgi:hypothetical protein